MSERRIIISRIRQSSILGPLSFGVFVNDLTKATKKKKIWLNKNPRTTHKKFSSVTLPPLSAAGNWIFVNDLPTSETYSYTNLHVDDCTHM